MADSTWDLADSATDEAAETPTRRRQQSGGVGRAVLVYGGGLFASLITTGIAVMIFMNLTAARTDAFVDIDQPDAKIYLNGNALSVRVPGKMKTVKVPIKEGTHELKVVKEGYKTWTGEVSYRKGQPQPVVKVRLQKLVAKERVGS